MKEGREGRREGRQVRTTADGLFPFAGHFGPAFAALTKGLALLVVNVYISLCVRLRRNEKMCLAFSFSSLPPSLPPSILSALPSPPPSTPCIPPSQSPCTHPLYKAAYQPSLPPSLLPSPFPPPSRPCTLLSQSRCTHPLLNQPGSSTAGTKTNWACSLRVAASGVVAAVASPSLPPPSFPPALLPH